MKKLLSLFIALIFLLSSVPASADEAVIRLNELEHEQYMYEETVVVSGYSNVCVTLALYYPADFASQAKYIMTYSPEELSEGIEIQLGENDGLWPQGVWTIIVQSGDVQEILEFTLCEVRDEEDEKPTDAPTNDDDNTPNTPPKKPSGNNTSVTAIVPEKTDVTLTEGETQTVNIKTSASSLSVEVDDKTVVSASAKGKVLTVTALKRGKSQIWVKAGGNYASINVTVNPKPYVDDSTQPTEEATEEPTEEKPFVNPFDDISNHWAHDSIISLYRMGIINGMDEHTFAPDENVTRAQFVTMIQKAFDLKFSLTKSPFNDVKPTDWYFASVMASYENNIAKGGYDSNFNPESLVTRQDMAVFAYRAAVNSGKTFPLTNITTFEDHTSISDYAVEAVYSMKSASVINGMTDTTFEPSGYATRAQAAHIIAKLLQLR